MLRRAKVIRPKNSSRSQQQPERPAIKVIHRDFTHNPSDAFASFLYDSLPATVRNQTKYRVTIVWFDPHCAIDDTIVDTRLTKRALTTAINDVSLNCFSNRDECVNYLRQHQNTGELIFLVASGRNSTDLLDQLDAPLMKFIDSIFIFCLKKQMYEPLMLTRDRIVGIYHEHKTLIPAIHHEIRALSQRDLTVTFHKENGKNGYLVPSEVQAKFVWMRLIKESLLRLPQRAEAIKKMHDRLLLMSRRDSYWRKQIIEFINTYQPKDAIMWYTKDGFLFRHINSAMRTENVNELLACQPYIADLCREMKAKRTPVLEALTFYRGCVLYNDEIDTYRNNIGFLMGINTFFSASRDRDVAKDFAGCGTLGDDTIRMSVIFEIHVDQDSSSIFTDISIFSDKRDEHEVLFDWNSIFQIRHVGYHDSDKCWIIELIASREVQSENERLYQQLYSTSIFGTPWSSILIGLIHIGEYKQAHDYSTLLLSESPSDLDFLICHGLACYFECDYNQAIKSLKRAYAMIGRGASITNYIYIMATLLVINIILSSVGERKLAKKYACGVLNYTVELFRFLDVKSLDNRMLLKAYAEDNQVESSKYCVEICSKCDGINRYLSLPVVLVGYASDLLFDGNYDEALIQLEKAETEAIRFITSYSSVRFQLQMLFVSAYIHQHRLEKACEHLDTAYHIVVNNKSRSSPSALASYYIVLALICILKNEPQEAFDSCLPRARATYLKADGFVNIPNITLALWNVCHAHLRCANTTMDVSNRAQLEKLMDECFNLCELDKILYGKTQDNVHRHLLHYAQQTKLAASQPTDHEHSMNFDSNTDSIIVSRL